MQQRSCAKNECISYSFSNAKIDKATRHADISLSNKKIKKIFAVTQLLFFGA